MLFMILALGASGVDHFKLDEQLPEHKGDLAHSTPGPPGYPLVPFSFCLNAGSPCGVSGGLPEPTRTPKVLASGSEDFVGCYLASSAR